MTFNDNARLDPSKVRRRKRGAAIGAGGGGILVLALALLGPVLGVDLSGLAPMLGGGGGGGTSQDEGETLDRCQTGETANADLDCRMVGAATSLDAYWAEEAAAIGVTSYATPDFYLFEGGTETGCGSATSAVGPFYCPPDSALYMDTGFFEDLRTRFGAEGGPLAEMYVVAHEWGHHMQNLTGVLAQSQDGDTGPTSNAVRVELQADCFAGAWAAAASDTEDPSGTPLLEEITDEQVRQAVTAAEAVGDDRIQGTTANSHTWTHGSADQRQNWFLTGFRGGSTACDTFAPAVP